MLKAQLDCHDCGRAISPPCRPLPLDRSDSSWRPISIDEQYREGESVSASVPNLLNLEWKDR